MAEESYGDKVKKMINGVVKSVVKPRPYEIAAQASQEGMSSAQKKKVKDFTSSFTNGRSKNNKK